MKEDFVTNLSVTFYLFTFYCRREGGSCWIRYNTLYITLLIIFFFFFTVSVTFFFPLPLIYVDTDMGFKKKIVRQGKLETIYIFLKQPFFSFLTLPWVDINLLKYSKSGIDVWWSRHYLPTSSLFILDCF